MIVFVSDCHIGGDPGCDGFESPEELESLFEELAAYENPVELVLAGDFFNLLLIGEPPPQTNRARLTIERKEYKKMFDSLRRFASRENHRVIYLPGNHDAEVWWNPQVRETLRREGLVEEFSLSYLASVGGFTIYSEHGDQFDPANRIEDYSSPLSTPLGQHIVTDFERRLVPLGKIAWEVDFAEMKHIRPLGNIPRWITSRYFYSALGRTTTYLMLPFILCYLAYRTLAFFSVTSDDMPRIFYKGYLLIPKVNDAIQETSFFVFITLLLFGALFLLLKYSLQRIASVIAVSPGEQTGTTAQERIEATVRKRKRPPMLQDEESCSIDVFVSGHTHTPYLAKLEQADGGQAVVANCGCWLRQLLPVRARFKGPPVFASRFVLTHVRVFLQGSRLRVELWEHPKRSSDRLTRMEKLAICGRMPHQPAIGAKPRIISAREIPDSSHAPSELR